MACMRADVAYSSKQHQQQRQHTVKYKAAVVDPLGASTAELSEAALWYGLEEKYGLEENTALQLYGLARRTNEIVWTSNCVYMHWPSLQRHSNTPHNRVTGSDMSAWQLALFHAMNDKSYCKAHLHMSNRISLQT